ncbi:MAG: N-acetyltransferase family protein [Solirubrobacteraceae bacterium]
MSSAGADAGPSHEAGGSGAENAGTSHEVGAGVRVRPAVPADVEQIFAFIVELAEYERAPDQVTGSPQMLADALFGQEPCAEALVAEIDGAAAGFALFHGTFSTWECRPGIWLEDLYIPLAHRRSGVGRALLAQLSALAVNRGCPRLEWCALDWNAPALDFYQRVGAERLSEWELHRLSGDALRRVAAGQAPG